MKEERTISISELVKYVMLKWRYILVGMICFAILLGGIAAARAYLYNSNVKQSQENQDVEQYESLLTEEEIQEVEDAENNYLTYEKIYRDYQNYMSNSIKMQLDANNVPTKRIIYQISGHDQAGDIADTYSDIFPNSDVCEKVAEEIDLTIDVSYIKELISITNSHMNTITINGQQISSVVNEREEVNNSILMAITVISDDEENCETIGSVIESEINNTTEELKKQFGDFNIQKIDDSYCEETNNELMSEQHERINEMNNISSIMQNMETSLSDQQKEYFSSLLKKDKIDNDGREEIVKMQYINLKYIFVGAIFGILIVGFYLICKYLMNKRFTSNCFIETDLQSPLLGVFCETKEKKKIGSQIDKWINSWFEQKNESFLENEKLHMLVANIRVLMQKKDLKNLYVTSTVKTNEIKQFLLKLQEEFKDSQMDCIIGQSILYDVTSMEKFAQADSVIFIEQKEKSLNSEIYEETKYANKYGINILGFVVIE